MLTTIGGPSLKISVFADTQSELPFRMLCREHGATAAYTPMIHSRLYAESERYRQEIFSTCPEDRPLFVQVLCVIKRRKLLYSQCVLCGANASGCD